MKKSQLRKVIRETIKGELLTEKETACQKAAKIGINACYDKYWDEQTGTFGSGHTACHNGVIATFKACKAASGELGISPQAFGYDHDLEIDTSSPPPKYNSPKDQTYYHQKIK